MSNIRQRIIPIFTLILVAATLTVGAMVFRYYMTGFQKKENARIYDRYYMMITDNPKSDFWQSVYLSAQTEAGAKNAYVELLGENLKEDYSCEEQMRIAVSARPDGIIVYADESDRMKELINEASSQGIPVVTLYGDNTQSNRLSFVGVGSYNIGREYGRQIFNIIKEKRRLDFKDSESIAQRKAMQIYVLVNTNVQDTMQNIVISGLQETISQENATDSEFSISIVPVDNTNAFSVEESIRDLFLQENAPDVILCLNELNTICAYQAVVDFNKVGEVNILGYYDSEPIINAIDRNVVYATISIDTRQLGAYCIEALSDYFEFGNTSEYYTADVTLIDQNNVAEYLSGEMEP